MRNIPNMLTAIRVALAPVIFWAILSGNNLLAMALFATAAVTDWLDGTMARRYGWITWFGAYIDPVADKLLMDSMFIALAIASMLPWWFVVLVVGRDLYILISVMILAMFVKVREFPPSAWGKWCTFAQIITAGTWMVTTMTRSFLLDVLCIMALWAATVLTLYSGIHYTWRGVHMSRTHVPSTS